MLESLNPTGGLFTDYDPQSRATAALGPNLTTLAETRGVHPDTPLRIYRGAPPNQKSIVPGDFVTDNPQLARDYAGSSKVLSLDTTHGDVLDDRTEPGGGEYIYRPRTRPVITAAEARGNSRPVSAGEYMRLAAAGKRQLDAIKQDTSPITGLDTGWPSTRARAWQEAQKSWGGATINAHTGEFVHSDADLYALSVKPRGIDTVSVPETASQDAFNQAMDAALAKFRPVLERRGYHLGVFHDDEHNRIDIDPVLIVSSTDQVEQIGAHTRAIGGAYHFRTGDGYWPPHVAEGAGMANDDDQVHFDGIGQWHSKADAIQDPEPDDTPDND